MAKLVGANSTEVAVMNTLTVNLHLMLAAFYRPTTERHKILIEGKAFPSDTHAVVSQIQHHHFDAATSLIEIVPRENENILREEDIEQVIAEHGSSIAVILLSGVQYYTGQFFDIPRITKAGHKAGCIVGFDLAHAVGNVPLYLHDWEVDFACWCTYKYMNCGPGSIGGCFVHDHNDTTSFIETDKPDRFRELAIPRFSGWWGHRVEDRFLMDPQFIPSAGAYGFRVSNPSVFLIAAVRSSLDIFDKVSCIIYSSNANLLF